MYEPGTVILDNTYRIEEELGRGAFGVVYRATDLELKVSRAIKVLRSDEAGVGGARFIEYRKRFKQEATLAAKLTHPHVIQVYRFVDRDGVLHLIMEYAPGGTLARLLAESGPQPVDRVVAMVREAAEGLGAVHEQLNAVHRDVKPANLLLDGQGHVKVADFGLAQVPGPDGSRHGSMGSSHPGTPNYNSPEHSNGSVPLAPTADVYGLGCVAYELLTGEVWRLVRHRVRRSGTLRKGTPRWLTTVVWRMLSEKPGVTPDDAGDASKRYVSMAAVIQALPTIPQPQRKSHRTLVMLLLILGLVVLGVLAASYRHLWPFAPPTPIPIRPATPVAGAKAPITVTALPSPTATPEPDELALIINPVDQAIYVPVPAGEFAMGSPPGAGFDDEQPQRQVTLDRFWIGQTEVTNGMYGRCVAAGACTAPDNSRWNDPVYVEHPVVNVNWFQATAYAAWVGGRLPTEAEWEKAACGADARIFPWGNDAPDATHGNFMQETGDTAPVGSFAAGASPYQALDMAGNVWEWVNDWFGDPYAPDGPIANPAGPATGERRVLRGAAWGNDSDALRCTYRYGYFPDEGRQNYGFRVVLTPEAMPPATQPGEALAP